MKKHFLMPEAYWDTALLERWLEEKAVQGWRPVSFSRYGSGKFEPAGAQEAPVSAGAPADRDL